MNLAEAAVSIFEMLEDTMQKDTSYPMRQELKSVSMGRTGPNSDGQRGIYVKASYTVSGVVGWK